MELKLGLCCWFAIKAINYCHYIVKKLGLEVPEFCWAKHVYKGHIQMIRTFHFIFLNYHILFNTTHSPTSTSPLFSKTNKLKKTVRGVGMGGVLDHNFLFIYFYKPFDLLKRSFSCLLSRLLQVQSFWACQSQNEAIELLWLMTCL